MTPSEFVEVLTGARETERVHRLGYASIVSVVLGFGGTSITPEALIGEEVEYGPNPFKPGDDAHLDAEGRQARRAQMLEALRESAKRAHDEWMPQGVTLDGDD